MAVSDPNLLICHISDLHFGPFLQGFTRVGEWKSFAAPHGFDLVTTMGSVLDRIMNRGVPGDRLIFAFTGDMTTAAEPPAYEVVNNYVRDTPFVSSSSRVGLGLNEKSVNVFFVPGNHDMWLYGNIFTRWKGYSNRREQYSRYFPERLPNVYPLLVNGLSVTIFTIDSNRISKSNLFNFRNVLGRGEVGKLQINDLRLLADELSSKRRPVPQGFDYGASLKVALLHHHLALPPGCPRDLEQEFLLLEDANDVIDALCSIGIQIVLCGHQHFPYHIPDLSSACPTNNKIFLSCAGSATQQECSRNSFSTYAINRNGDKFDLHLTVYEADSSNAGKFVIVDEADYSI